MDLTIQESEGRRLKEGIKLNWVEREIETWYKCAGIVCPEMFATTEASSH